METNNFDNKIKNQLEQRTIEPSAKSWEQLRSKLDKKDKKLVPIFWWTTIAATFVGGVLLISFLFNSSTFVQNDSITKENIETVPKTETKETIFEKVQIQETLVYKESTQEEKEIIKEPFIPVEEKKPVIEVAEVADVQKNESFENESIQNEITEKAIAEVVEQIKYSEMTDTEVDALLEVALSEISKKRIADKGSISAIRLLEDVEEEVERSFRERVFELIRDGFSLSKDALANRNQ
jgi:hypothetical protein